MGKEIFDNEKIILQPINGRNTFYWKCRVDIEWDIAKLISYWLEVAKYDCATKQVKVYWWFSAATGTHIDSFLAYYGVPPMTKKEKEGIVTINNN